LPGNPGRQPERHFRKLLSISALKQSAAFNWNKTIEKTVSAYHTCFEMMSSANNISKNAQPIQSETEKTKLNKFELTPSHPNTIIWLRPDSIGDIVLSNSMLPYIKGIYPHAMITVMCQGRTSDLYESCPFVDAIVPIDSSRLHFDPAYQQLLLHRLKSVQVDIVLNSVYSRGVSTELLVLATGAPQRIAISGDATNCAEEDLHTFGKHYTKLIASPGIWKIELERHRDFLAGLGCTEITPGTLQPLIWLTSEDERFVDDLIVRHGLMPEKTIILFAAAQIWIRLYKHYGQALAELCQDRGLTVVAVGVAGERELNQQQLDVLGTRTLNLCGELSIRQTAALVKRCALAVGAETGTAHIAAAVGTPHVVVIGGGHFGRFMPYSPLTTLVCMPLDCYYCNWRCRYSSNHCISDIPVAVLTEAIGQTLDSREDGIAKIFFPNAIGCAASPDMPQSLDLQEYVERIPEARLRIKLCPVAV